MPFGFFGFFHLFLAIGHELAFGLSPMPFGFFGFFHLESIRSRRYECTSPMPFGFFGFFHIIFPAEFKTNLLCVSNAFRLLRVFPRQRASGAPQTAFGLSPMPFGFFGFFHIRTLIVRDMEAKSGLQCLSASSGFSTTSDRKESYRHAAAVSNAFRLLRVFPHQPFN